MQLVMASHRGFQSWTSRGSHRAVVLGLAEEKGSLQLEVAASEVTNFPALMVCGKPSEVHNPGMSYHTVSQKLLRTGLFPKAQSWDVQLSLQSTWNKF